MGGVIQEPMGTFSVKVTIVNPLNPDRSVTVDCLVDTGAAYSQLPRSLLASIGIEPFDDRRFVMADGRQGTCQVGKADFFLNGRQTPSLVVFGEEAAPPLLGAMTLEGLGFGVDPLSRRLVPIDLPLASDPLRFPPRRKGVSPRREGA